MKFYAIIFLFVHWFKLITWLKTLSETLTVHVSWARAAFKCVVWPRRKQLLPLVTVTSFITRFSLWQDGWFSESLWGYHFLREMNRIWAVVPHLGHWRIKQSSLRDCDGMPTVVRRVLTKPKIQCNLPIYICEKTWFIQILFSGVSRHKLSVHSFLKMNNCLNNTNNKAQMYQTASKSFDPA